MLSYLKKIISFKKAWLPGLLVTGIAFTFAFKEGDDNTFEISKNLDIFTTLFRELTIYYVDPLDAQDLVHEGIDAMLESLDPYTQFIPEESADDYRFMTTGQYGGIGALIGQRGDDVIITDPYEGFPAQKNGVLAGDIIRAVDGKSTKGKDYDEISRMLKGTPHTNVTLLLERQGEAQPVTKVIMRDEIQIKNVPYYGMIDNSTGYIRLSSFTDNAGQEVRDAVSDLVQKKNAKGIILDLRSNPGGLLNEAIDIVNVFTPKGQEVVSTRGKVKEWDKSYKALNEPTDLKTPLAVLVNSMSASASEIVSGSLQDFDRGIIIGQRTFGKGLVQTTRPLVYNTQLKVTTAKYYIPSGRCIQALDYTHRNADGSVGKVPDSLITAFKTKNKGRIVYDGGGISPDYSLDPVTFSTISQSLVGKYLIFDFATNYFHQHPNIGAAKNFRISDADYETFISWVNSKDFEYTTESEKRLADLKEKAKKENYLASIEKDLNVISSKIGHDRVADLRLHKDEIKGLIENEIVSRYYFQNGRIENTFSSDPEIKMAAKALQDPAIYDAILSRTYKP